MTKQTWLEVSLVIDGELAEAVAEVLARFAPDGVVIETTAVGASPDDVEGFPVGPLRVSGFLPVNDLLEETRHRLEEALWYLGRIQPLPAAEYRLVEETNWAEAWKQHYKPIPIGSRLMIIPAWMQPENDERIAIHIDPGMAFGTGTHPTTQLCLEILEQYARDTSLEGVDILDVGCGTAILAVAALKLGAGRALGVDIDPEAISASRENASRNGVSDRLELGPGSVAEIISGQFSIQSGRVVFANILAPVLVRLLDDGLGRLVAADGILILSGILEEQVDTVLAAAQAHGLELADRRQIKDWVALSVKHAQTII